ncbi:MAG TPA: tyrosine-type recombinase/integrase [Candidatus Wunengus sp. YC63]|uniref:tyrosine-type recombinase/integrase n=1 Tax=unclassified Candidatus Wunengus TaxID=3367695 RepID=UPI0040288BE9
MGELLSLQWSRVNLFRKTILIQESKNGKPRTIPLTQKAENILTEKAISYHPHLLNAFKHITAMVRAQVFRKLDYADYFVRRNVSFEDDNKTMDRILNFFHKTIIKKISKVLNLIS